jgi:hypothetical protein
MFGELDISPLVAAGVDTRQKLSFIRSMQSRHDMDSLKRLHEQVQNHEFSNKTVAEKYREHVLNLIDRKAASFAKIWRNTGIK